MDTRSPPSNADAPIVDERVLIIDDVLEDPDQFRRAALEADYPVTAQQMYPGRNSAKRFLLPGLDKHVSAMTGQTLTPKRDSLHGTFRMCFQGETGKGGVHIDLCHWSGILYLSLPEHCRGGTDFFRHRESGQTRAPVYQEDWAHWGGMNSRELFDKVINGQRADPSKWELSQHIDMKYNRLILFRPWLWHNAGPGFGGRPENARIVYVLFYEDPSWC